MIRIQPWTIGVALLGCGSVPPTDPWTPNGNMSGSSQSGSSQSGSSQSGSSQPSRTHVQILFYFGTTQSASCGAADMSNTAGDGDLHGLRGLRYKLTCGANVFKNTTDTSAQLALCATSPTVATFDANIGSRSCVIEAQVLTATAGYSSSYPMHCDYYGSNNFTVVGGASNSVSVVLQKQYYPLVCPLEKQL